MDTPHDLMPAPSRAIQLFEPDPRTAYTIEMTAHLVGVPRHTILVYCKYGLVSPVVDPACGGYYFNDEAIRVLRRVEYLRDTCGVNLAGIKMILELMNKVERLESELSSLRQMAAL
jgi:MerR family transcriptional regulator/heat shock protein HspR